NRIRSVVVVLPASMCAMMPMLRTRVRSVSTSRATAFSSLSNWRPTVGRSPAVVGEGLVGLRHLVHVLAPLDGGAEAVARVEQLVHEPLDHGLLAALRGVGNQPTQAERGLSDRADLDRHLVGGATDTAAAHLQRGLHVVQRALERDDRVGAGLVPGALEGRVDNAL